MKREVVDWRRVRFDLEFFVKEKDDGLDGEIWCSTDHYNAGRIAGMAEDYRRLLEQISARAAP